MHPSVPVPSPAGEGDLPGALARVANLLIPGETVQAWSIQRRLFSLMHRPVLVVATSSRLMVIRRGLFGGLSMTGLQWQDLKDAVIREGIFSSELTVRERDGQIVMVDWLEKDSAQRVYVRAQTEEQAWREKNRIRDMERMRAQAGGVQITGLTSEPSSSPAARLQEARAMLDKGLISDTEFETIKAKIVSVL